MQIGDHCWFAENLRNEVCSNGDSIPLATSEYPLHNQGASARVAYDYSTEEIRSEGWIYSGFVAIDSRGVCPAGWDIPEDDDFKNLETWLGMSNEQANESGYRDTNQATHLKSSISDSPAWNGTNATGFSAIPCGVHYAAFQGGSSTVHLWYKDGLRWNSDNYYRAIEKGDGIFRATHNIAEGHSFHYLKKE